MMYWYGNGMGWGYVLMTVTTVLFWALVIAGVVALIRYLSRKPGGTSGTGGTAGTGGGPAAPSRPTPEQLLAERFARGEIDEQEYRRGLEVLRGEHHTPSQP
ncbi:SHOCT domain-containing protein [Amycolatopsis cynarae]|uniref:SHOCT domain-containing protein n=1 Tax=Amycolatopsis cynarae TaxID=2995223 RepID=A0ABY7AX23_9PSEU|nr:SHOCT domain-containing protein [Amycolatopsis sp. HUAS 11-8]WAL64577.1 SHOCT domain-containing protein [Amycolatopsis sp. HUAS 11-8]